MEVPASFRRSSMREFFGLLAHQYGPGVRVFANIWTLEEERRDGGGIIRIIPRDIVGHHGVRPRPKNYASILRLSHDADYPIFDMGDNVDVARQEACIYLARHYDYSHSRSLYVRKTVAGHALITIPDGRLTPSGEEVEWRSIEVNGPVRICDRQRVVSSYGDDVIKVDVCRMLGEAAFPSMKECFYYMSLSVSGRDVVVEATMKGGRPEMTVYVRQRLFSLDDGLYVAIYRALKYLTAEHPWEVVLPVRVVQKDRHITPCDLPVRCPDFAFGVTNAYIEYCRVNNYRCPPAIARAGRVDVLLPCTGRALYAFGCGDGDEAQARAYAAALQFMLVRDNFVFLPNLLLPARDWRYGLVIPADAYCDVDLIYTRGFGVIMTDPPAVETSVVLAAVKLASLGRNAAVEPGLLTPEPDEDCPGLEDLDLN